MIIMKKSPTKVDPADEHLARLKAEADALDKTNRLRVAQEQLLEYAIQKAGDAEALLKVVTQTSK